MYQWSSIVSELTDSFSDYKRSTLYLLSV